MKLDSNLEEVGDEGEDWCCWEDVCEESNEAKLCECFIVVPYELLTFLKLHDKLLLTELFQLDSSKSGILFVLIRSFQRKQVSLCILSINTLVYEFLLSWVGIRICLHCFRLDFAPGRLSNWRVIGRCNFGPDSCYILFVRSSNLVNLALSIEPVNAEFDHVVADLDANYDGNKIGLHFGKVAIVEGIDVV